MKGTITRAATALFGFALGLGLGPSLYRAASPGDLPSGLKAAGQSPASLVAQFIVPLILTAVFAWIGSRVVLEKQWAFVSYSVALALAPVTLIHFGNIRHVVLHGVVAAAIVFLRNFEPRFTRDDAVLLPMFASCLIAFLDLEFGKTPAATFLRAAIVVFAMRLIAGAFAKIARPALAFAASPIALAFAWSPVVNLIVLFATPFVLARFVDEEKLARFLRFVAYPIAAFAYPLVLLGVTAPPHVNFYEDGHDIPVAAEMMRGERPYRDIIPLHGLVPDGGLSWTAMHLGASDIGAELRVRLVAGALMMVAIYFVALAATGSAELAILAVFLAFCMFPEQTIWLRPMPALFALACILGPRKRFLAAGALIVVAAFFSAEFALYTFLVALFSRPRKSFFIGIVAAALPILLLFAIGGFLTDFIRVTLDLALHRSAYFMSAIEIPPCLHSLSSLVQSLGDWRCLAAILWVIALITAATVRTNDALRYVAAWMVIAGLSYIDRHNYHFALLGAVFIVVAISRLPRPAMIALTIVVLFLARPFEHFVSVVPALRKAHGIGDGVMIEGALFDPQAANAIGTARRFAATLKPNETFVDFAGATMLYPLLRRDCPLRQAQIGIMETQAAQREVIDRLERNRNVTAALIIFPPALSNIDDVPNRERAPLVWRYLNDHFAPAFDENGVVFWKRR